MSHSHIITLSLDTPCGMKAMDPPPLRRLQRKLTVDVLWIYVVSVLLSEGPTYGYDVRKRIRGRFGFAPATVTTYTVLYRLEREGVIGRDESGLYKVTPRGEELYRRALEFMRGILERLEAPSPGRR